ncbi:S-layer homology domain-containing protein [Effusibacillus dendaii]|nr:S-layer homology domain-containing protein [Effusibacillus dendaii]
MPVPSRRRLSRKALSGTIAISLLAPLPLLPTAYSQTALAAAAKSDSQSQGQYTDVPPGHWAFSAVQTLSNMGIVRGKATNLFAPSDTITRAEFVTLLLRALKTPLDPDSTPVFDDVPASYFAFKEIQTASKLKVFGDASVTSFQPDQPITRQDMAYFIANALQIPAVSDAVLKSTGSFADADQISPDEQKGVAIASQLKIINGYPDSTFKPLATATRAEAAGMIYNLLQVPAAKINDLKTSVQVSRIQITPDQVKLVAGETLSLTAQLFNKANSTVSGIPVVWSVDGLVGQISSDGVFTALVPGSGKITATVRQPGQSPVTASVNVTVEAPKHLAFSNDDYGSHKPTETINLTVKVNDENGKFLQTDNLRAVTFTITGPDGTFTTQASTVNGVAQLQTSKTKAGTYTVTASARGTILDKPATFVVTPGDLAKLDVHAAPSTFVRPGQDVQISAKGLDMWDNEISTFPVTFKVNDSRLGSISSNSNSPIGTLKVGNTQGSYTITAQSGSISATQQLTVYTSAADLSSGKGEWMMYSDWKNYPVDQTIQRLKDAGVTHVYMLNSTTTDGFFGQDAIDDFLPKAHKAGIAVVGWIYAANNDPWKDAGQTIQVINYTTPTGDRFDGIAADIEENLAAYQQEAFAKGIRDATGPNYPLFGVIYPATWKPNQPWSVYSKYYDVLEPMVYWHFKSKPYTYKEAYDSIGAEITKLRQLTRQDMPIKIVGQSYNMFPGDAGQYPQPYEIRGAMQAAKDYGAIGYSTYRGRTATPAEWNEFASFNW